MTDTWTMVAETRADLASYLATLTPEQWNAPTLCDKWKVRDVVGHLVEGANKIPMGKLVGGMLKSGFNLNKMLAATALEEGKHSPEELLKAMRDTVSMRNTPPMTKPEDLLADTVIHTQDIRRALDTPGTIPEARVRAALDSAKNAAIVGSKKRVAGLKLVATDMEWTYGNGPEVRGTGEALLLAMCGRTSAYDELTGDGVATLRQR
ncbi:MAG: hypothetical protein QOH28_875 [Actinomycetota bacterium]|jgi:uncharacterized protein (TIGR03083 family)|nr:hypothetical protein [Actinomycetota bacterium]